KTRITSLPTLGNRRTVTSLISLPASSVTLGTVHHSYRYTALTGFGYPSSFFSANHPPGPGGILRQKKSTLRVRGAVWHDSGSRAVVPSVDPRSCDRIPPFRIKHNARNGPSAVSPVLTSRQGGVLGLSLRTDGSRKQEAGQHPRPSKAPWGSTQSPRRHTD